MTPPPTDSKDAWSNEPKSGRPRARLRGQVRQIGVHDPGQKSVRVRGERSGLADIWGVRESNIQVTADLDRESPETLFYVGRLIQVGIDALEEVYVEHLASGRTKHWTVLSERDYEVIDQIYDIEQEVLDRFPSSDLTFRVTVMTDRDPSVSEDAIKIYDAS